VDYFGVKIFLASSFFCTLILAAFWAKDKFNEYWGDDEDGGES
jgi:ABC-type transport system involved in cytochrome c biogenesis permease subunit